MESRDGIAIASDGRCGAPGTGRYCALARAGEWSSSQEPIEAAGGLGQAPFALLQSRASTRQTLEPARAASWYRVEGHRDGTGAPRALGVAWHSIPALPSQE